MPSYMYYCPTSAELSNTLVIYRGTFKRSCKMALKAEYILCKKPLEIHTFFDNTHFCERPLKSWISKTLISSTYILILFSPCFETLICFRGRETSGEERERERDHSIVHFSDAYNGWGMSGAEGGSQELHLGLWQWWQAPKHLILRFTLAGEVRLQNQILQ